MVGVNEPYDGIILRSGWAGQGAKKLDNILDEALGRHRAGIRFTRLEADQFELRDKTKKQDLSQLALPKDVEVWLGPRSLCILKGVECLNRGRDRWLGRFQEIR